MELSNSIDNKDIFKTPDEKIIIHPTNMIEKVRISAAKFEEKANLKNTMYG